MPPSHLHTASLSITFTLSPAAAVYVDYVKRITGAINASRPTMLFGSGIQTGLLPKRSNPKYLRLLCQAKLLGGVRGSFTQGG